MANLKEINAAIKDGNKDIHALIEKIKAWVESQKKIGDDLEAEREKKKINIRIRLVRIRLDRQST